MTRWQASCLTLLTLAPLVRGGAPPIRLDAHGDPLPPYAAARLGTQRFQCAENRNHGCTSVSYSPDGKAVAVGAGDVYLWDTATGKLVRRFRQPSGFARSVDFGAGGKTLVVGSYFSRAITVFDVASGEQLRVLGRKSHPGDIARGDEQSAVRRVVLLPGGKTAAAHMAGYETDPVSVRLVEKEAILWDLATGEMLASSEPADPGPYFTFLAVSGDGGQLASNAKDHNVIVWRHGDGKRVQLLAGHTKTPLCAAFLANDTVLSSGGMDRTVRLWDLATGKALRKLDRHEHPILCLFAHPDGKQLVSLSRERVCLWEAATGKLLREFRSPQDDLQSFALSPDGQGVAAVTHAGVLHQWELATGKDLFPVAGHRDAVGAVAFTPDGSTLISGGLDGLIVWDANKRALLRRLGTHGLG